MEPIMEMLETILVGVEPEEDIQLLIDLSYKRYLKTKYWDMVRDTMHEHIGKKCEICGNGKNIHVHHFNYENLGKETFNDLACLCEGCHFAMHNMASHFSLGIYNRVVFRKQMKFAKEIKKNFSNKKYLNLLPISQKACWTVEKLANLYDVKPKNALKMFEDDIKSGLIEKFCGKNSLGDHELYYINSFVWHVIKLDFPKI